jgi:hypothetical protein
VFLESQALAVHTRFGIGQVDTVVGTYAGVLLPPTSQFLSFFPPVEGQPTTTTGTTTTSGTGGGTTGTATPTITETSNTIAVFSLSVPDTGLATGTFLAFAGGRTFNGTIDGLADPDSANILAVLQGTLQFSLTFTTTSTSASGVTTTVNTVPVTATATGSLQATVSAPLAATVTTTPALARLGGSAHLDVNFGNLDPNTLAPEINGSLDFIVIGFKQSNVAGASAAGGAAGNGTGTGTGGGTGASAGA